jgi:SagB-type dehydrogenase family enzyme
VNICVMAMNKDINYAAEYHEATKHSETSLMSSRHYLDFDNKPIPFKVYLELPSVPLPVNFPTPEVNTIRCITSRIHQISRIMRSSSTSTSISEDTRATSGNMPNIDLADLAEILFFSAGITREMKYPYGNYYMRAASATGALYPIELYVVCDDISPSLDAGAYHFSPADFSLTQIRKGKYKSYLAASANDQDILSSPIIIIFTSFAWRNAWKYQARSYRHWFWDSGVIAANLVATTAAMELPTRLIMGFVDEHIDQLLCLEYQKEAAIAMAAIGVGRSKGPIKIPQQDAEIKICCQSIPKIRPLSKRTETNYPEIWKLNEASKLASKEDVRRWISNSHRHDDLLASMPHSSHEKMTNGAGANNIIPKELENDINNSLSLKETILWRGSTRKFTRSSISLSALKTILYSASRGVQMDILKEGNSLIDIYFIANAVDGLNPGAYFYNRNTTSLKKIKEVAASRNISTYLCLGQSLFGDASVVFFLLTDLQSILRSLGNRGYRVCQFEAGVITGKLYLASYALGIGASGSTFFDDAVTEFFSAHAGEKSAMMAIGVGVPGYKANPGKILPKRLSKKQLMTEDFT